MQGRCLEVYPVGLRLYKSNYHQALGVIIMVSSLSQAILIRIIGVAILSFKLLLDSNMSRLDLFLPRSFVFGIVRFCILSNIFESLS